MNNKTEIVNIRFTTKEKQVLEQKSQKTGLSKSAYIRNLIIDSKIKPTPTKEYLELSKQVQKIGYNVNQIAKAVNLGVAQPYDIDYVKEQLSSIYKLLKGIA